MRKKNINFLLTAVFFGAAFFQAAQTQAQTCAPAPVGLAAWYQAENNALDSRGGNNGTLQGGASFAAGKVGQAFNLNGTDAFVQAPSSPANDPTTAGSLEVWVQFNQLPSATHTMEIIGKGGSGTDFDLQADTDDRFRLYIAGGTSVASTTAIQTGVWYHVVGAWDSTVGLNMYVNGALESTNGALVTRGQSGQPLEIGNQPTFGPRLFSGLIDEASVYNRQLSAAEVQAIYNSGASGKCKPTATAAPVGQVLWLAGDGDVRDLSGSGNNGTLQNGASFAVGKVGQGFNFNSGNSNQPNGVEVNASASLNVGTGSGMTIEMWIRPTDVSRGQILAEWSDGNNTGVNFAINLVVGDNANGNMFINFVDTNGTNHIVQTAQNLLTANVYQYVAASYDKTTGIGSIYLNGAVVASQNLGVFTPLTTYDLYFGRRITTGGIFSFNGQLDEPSVYSRALSPTEIQSIYNADLAGKLKQPTTATNAATVGSATVTFSNAAARTVQEIPLNPNLFPALPAATNTGLVFDVAASVPDSSPTVCFNLPSFTAAQFSSLRVYHFESGAWVNRTAATNAYPNLCTSGLTSLSPFAIGTVNAPTAATASVSGRVSTRAGRGVAGARIYLTDAGGNTRIALTNAFGYYRFSAVATGETYIVRASAKRYVFQAPTQVLSVNEEIANLNFEAYPNSDAGRGF